MYKNIEKQTKLILSNQITYQPHQVVSKTLVLNDLVSMTLFSFDKGEEISSHAAGSDAMVTVLEEKWEFTVGGEEFVLRGKGDADYAEGRTARCVWRREVQDADGGVVLNPYPGTPTTPYPDAN